MMSTFKEPTIHDAPRKSLYSVVSNKVQIYEYPFEHEGKIIMHSWDEIKEILYNDPVQLFNTVREALSEDEDISAAFAHAKCSARIKTEFCTDGAFFFGDPDVMLLESILIHDVLGFSDREKYLVYYHELKSWMRYVSRQERKNQKRSHKAAELLHEEVA